VQGVQGCKARACTFTLVNSWLAFLAYTRLTLSSDKPVYTLRFIQTPAADPAPRKKTPEFVYMHLMLLRLKEQDTDIIVTVNIPHYAGEYEKPKEGEGDVTQLMKDSEAVKSRILESFNIKDWGLFQG
jgi:hypothetical protein